MIGLTVVIVPLSESPSHSGYHIRQFYCYICFQMDSHKHCPPLLIYLMSDFHSYKGILWVPETCEPLGEVSSHSGCVQSWEPLRLTLQPCDIGKIILPPLRSLSMCIKWMRGKSSVCPLNLISTLFAVPGVGPSK